MDGNRSSSNAGNTIVVEPRRANSERQLRTLDLRWRTIPKKSVSPIRTTATGSLSQYSSYSREPSLPGLTPSSTASSLRDSIQQIDAELGGSIASSASSFTGSMSGSPTWSRRSSANSTPVGGLTRRDSAKDLLASASKDALQSSLTQVSPAKPLLPLPRQSKALFSTFDSITLSQDNNATIPQSDAQRARLLKVKQQPLNLSPCRKIAEKMLPPPAPEKADKMMLVLDIDETLVHASFTPEVKHDAKVTITVGNETGNIYVAYRPHLKAFLTAVAPLFEIAVFTASQACYAQQLMDIIDPTKKLGQNRLFREHCTEVNGARVKDLSLLGRPLERMVIIDNSPVAYLFQPRNAIPILSWFDDPNDDELMSLLPFLRQLATCTDVYPLLDMYNTHLSEKPRTPPKEQLE